MSYTIERMSLLAQKVPNPELNQFDQKAKEMLWTFTVFNNLPTELRLLIWEHAFPDGQVVNIRLFRTGRTQPGSHYLACYIPVDTHGSRSYTVLLVLRSRCTAIKKLDWRL